MRKIGILFAAYLTIGVNHNAILSNGTSVGLNINQPIYGALSVNPYGFFDTNKGFRDRSGGMDLDYALTQKVIVSVGASYEKYELLAANDPTETHNIHTAVSFKLW